VTEIEAGEVVSLTDPEPAAAVEVLRSGPLATIQDAGRLGYARLGVPESGAADRRSYAVANALAGNPAAAAAIEVTFGGLELRARASVVVAVAGAPCLVTVDGAIAAFAEAITMPAGSILKLGPPRHGLRTYVAVRGGINVSTVLGSRSTDVLTGIGPPVLGGGSVLPVGAAGDGEVPPPIIHPVPAELRLAVHSGPRADWFAPDAIRALCAAPYTVLLDSNRIALRLNGLTLVRRRAGELAPEGLVRGAIQVPPDGQPVLFLADHPVTGGYPVLAVVEDDDQWLAAQARPGAAISFWFAG
jgi:biotin-dependent carboxylase-like uncharacterized protein